MRTLSFCLVIVVLLGILGCTTGSVATSHAVSSGDYIDLQSGGFKGNKVAVRIYGDGRVVRDSAIVFTSGYVSGCPLHESDQYAQTDAAKAKALITEAQRDGFLDLKNLYQKPALDGGTAQLILSINGKRKSVTSHNGEPPPVFNELIGKIEALAPPMPAYSDWLHHSRERAEECRLSYQHSEDIVSRHRELFPGD